MFASKLKTHARLLQTTTPVKMNFVSFELSLKGSALPADPKTWKQNKNKRFEIKECLNPNHKNTK